MRFFIAILCTIFSSGAIAANLIDSIGVENQNGHQVIIHKVERKQTYYSIGRLYNVSPLVIIEQNKNIPLKVGVIIKVPTTRPYNQTAISNSSAQNQSNTDIIEYKVGPKEYLYAIARRFNTTVEDIKALNNLKSNDLSIGQILKVRQGGQAEIPPVVRENPVEEERPKIPTGRLGVSERSERGVAVWISDENLDGTKMLALHRTAPVGTVVKVTNPMTDRITFVKVVGKFTENESTKDVIIVLTKATAELLGALDKRFQVTIDYGMPHE